MEYYSIYENLIFYSIGGLWGYAIMRIRDNNGESKIRLAKCKKNYGFPKTEKEVWTELEVSQIENLSQVSRINFKTYEELEACYLKLREIFEENNFILL